MRARGIPVVFRKLLRGLIGEPPIPLHGGPPAWTVVAACIGAYAGALLVFGPVASAVLAAPVFIAAVILTGPLVAVAWLACLVVTITIVPVAELSRVGNGFDAPFVLISATILRAIVVTAVSSRTDHLHREAMLARRLDSVLEITERLANTHDRATLLRAIVDETLRGLDADATVLRLVKDDRLEVVAWAGLDDATAARLPVFSKGEAWFGEIAKTGTPWVVDDIRKATVGDRLRPLPGCFRVPWRHHRAAHPRGDGRRLIVRRDRRAPRLEAERCRVRCRPRHACRDRPRELRPHRPDGAASCTTERAPGGLGQAQPRE